MAEHAAGKTSVEAARRGSRACLFAGGATRVETPAYDWDRLYPGHRVDGPALIDDAYITFRYAETTELLKAAGAEVVDFDPLTDTRLPEGTTRLYLGGGFPEMHEIGRAHV